MILTVRFYFNQNIFWWKYKIIRYYRSSKLKANNVENDSKVITLSGSDIIKYNFESSYAMSNEYFYWQNKNYWNQSTRWFDDWNTTSWAEEDFHISKITVYADYYICAIEVTYKNDDGLELMKIHSVNNLYKKEKDIHKSTLEIDKNDYLDFIYCEYSSHKSFIRSITLKTQKEKYLVLEGQVELMNQNQHELIQNKRLKLSKMYKTGFESKSKSIVSDICLEEISDDDVSQPNFYINEEIKTEKMLKWESLTEKNSQNSFELKEPSMSDFYLKCQSLDLSKYKLKIIGFKTFFDGYIEDIQVYTKPANGKNLSSR